MMITFFLFPYVLARVGRLSRHRCPAAPSAGSLVGLHSEGNLKQGNSKFHRRRYWHPMASFIKEVNPWLAKRPLKTHGRLANLGLTSLVKEATGVRGRSWVAADSGDLWSGAPHTTQYYYNWWFQIQSTTFGFGLHVIHQVRKIQW